MADDLKLLAVQTALNKMFRQGYFDICTVDSAAKLLNVSPPTEPYQILRTLHCVHYGEMPAQLKQELPRLVRDCLSVEPNFTFEPQHLIATAHSSVIDAEVDPAPAKRGGFLRLLGRS